MTDDTAGTPTTKYCPDCGAQRPIDQFYRTKAKGYAGGYRYSAYCKTHAKARTARAAKNAPEGSKTREAIRRANRTYASAHPEQNRARVAAYRARKKARADAPPSSSDEPADDQAG
jgi:hypothetical protein